MLTDGFSPLVVADGTTEKALRLVLDHTGFRIRILSKNAVVGTERWIRLFAEHADRFVVGLSCGTMDSSWAHAIEKGTSSPSARIMALHALQDAKIPNYGMLCPIFPDVLADNGVEHLVDLINPEKCETVAGSYNDRTNWQRVRAGYPEGSPGWTWLTETYGGVHRDLARWSAYAAELYERLWAALAKRGCDGKLRYLLYEDGITAADARRFAGLPGVLLQSAPDVDGYSRNASIRALQTGPQHGRAKSGRGAGRGRSPCA